MTPFTMERLFAAMETSRGFPALESTVASVIAAIGEDNRNHSSLVPHIAEDFALTQKVLKLANSPMYAPFTQGAGSVSSAMEILGSEALMHIALSTHMVNDDELAADESLSQTLLASELARSVGGQQTEDVSVASLMYNLGNMAVRKHAAPEAELIDRAVASGQTDEAAAREVLGMSLQQVGSAIAQRWKLPASIVSIIDGTGDPRLVGIAQFSRTASALIHEGKSKEVAQLAAQLDVPGLDLSGLASLVSHHTDRLQAAAPRAAIAPISSEAVLNGLLASLANDKRQSVEALAAAMFPTFSDQLKAAHCLLFMQTKSGDFAIRYGYGKGIDELRSKLRIGKDYKPTAFHAAIKNNVDVSIADVSRLKTSALPDGFVTLLPNVNKFVILPIANSGVSGLVYCDWDTDTLLSPSELDIVKQLRGLFLPYFPP
jgi:HD-like signal output (HDOD) protein